MSSATATETSVITEGDQIVLGIEHDIDDFFATIVNSDGDYDSDDTGGNGESGGDGDGDKAEVEKDDEAQRAEQNESPHPDQA